MTVFILMEISQGLRSYTEVVDVYSDWNRAESARVGLELYKEFDFLSYEVVEWEVK